MTGERSYTTKIWRPPSSIGFSSADALSTSMDPPGEPVISTWKRPCQKIQNGSEFPELVAQNSRNPQFQSAGSHWRSDFDARVSDPGLQRATRIEQRGHSGDRGSSDSGNLECLEQPPRNLFRPRRFEIS